MPQAILRPTWRSCVRTSLLVWLTSASPTQTSISTLTMLFLSHSNNSHQGNRTRQSSTAKQSTVMSRKRKASPDISNERHCSPPILDPWGRDLTLEALTVAEKWWRVRRQIDDIGDDDLGSEHSTRLLVRAAELRREYTRLAAGWKRLDHVLQPNSRTYEPPVVEPDFPPLPFLESAVAYVVQGPARKYKKLQQNIDRCDYNRGAQWPISELVEVERQRREYNRLLTESWSSQGFIWEPRLPEPDLTAVITEESRQPTPELGERPALCPEQEGVVKLAEQGENIFYTGSAGCGKSTVLREIKRRLRAQGKVVEVVAPTGIVSLAINGSTTWAFMGWSPAHSKMTLEKLCFVTKANKRVRKSLCRVDTLIIDEISMVESNFFERMDKVLRYVRENQDRKELPFGGIQLIVTGDFCQLPPVNPFAHCVTCGFELSDFDTNTKICNNSCCGEDQFRLKDRFAFSSKAWEKCNFKYVHLKRVHRQQDGEFRDLLEKCRTGIAFSEAEIDILMKHESHTEDAVRLMPMREEVRQTNQAAFEKLPCPAFSYKCSDGRHIQDHHPHLQYKYAFTTALDEPRHEVVDFGQDHRFEEVLKLKKGMSVLLLVNLSLRDGLCNGSQGTIVDFESLSIDSLMARLKDKTGPDFTQEIETFARRNFNSWEQKRIVLPVVRFHNGIESTIHPECQVNELGDPAPYSRVWRTQIPLTAGYALTIHKAQGMTLERVIIKLDNVFEDEQVYVALSRSKTLEGLKIEVDKGRENVLKRALKGNSEVRRFMEEARWIEFE